MRFKLDENLPAELTEVPGRHGADVDTVPMEGLAGQPDAAIWSACLGEGRFLITQDLDFPDIRRYRPGTHPGLLLVRLDAPSRAISLRAWHSCSSAKTSRAGPAVSWSSPTRRSVFAVPDRRGIRAGHHRK